MRSAPANLELPLQTMIHLYLIRTARPSSPLGRQAGMAARDSTTCFASRAANRLHVGQPVPIMSLLLLTTVATTTGSPPPPPHTHTHTHTTPPHARADSTRLGPQNQAACCRRGHRQVTHAGLANFRVSCGLLSRARESRSRITEAASAGDKL